MDSLPPVWEAHAEPSTATDQAAGHVYVAVTRSWLHSRLRAVGCHAAQVSMAEAATDLWAVAASLDLACEMSLTDIEVPQPRTGTMSLGTPVLRADVREGLLLGAGSLRRAAPGAAALPVERTVTVGWIPRVDAEGRVLVPRGLAGVVLAVGRVDPGPADGVVDVLPVTVNDPTSSAAAPGGHRVGSPWGSGTRDKVVYNLSALGHFDRWIVGVGVGVGQQCLSVELPN